MAARPALPVEVNRIMATAFARSVRRHGILLTSAQILQQYNQYNARLGQDRSRQEILSSILDTLEGKEASAEPD
jgi:hypothetical protein